MNFNLLLSAAAAAPNGMSQEAAQTASTVYMVVTMVMLIVVFYFFILRPQKKKEKEAQELKASLQVGDEIVTIGGIYGRVISLKEDTIVIESVSDHSKITIARWALQANNTVHDDVPSK